MSNTNVTSRIVVGLGLAALFAIGLFMFTQQTRPVPVLQSAYDAAPPAAASSADAMAPALGPATGTADEAANEPSAPPALAPDSSIDAPVAAVPKPAKAKKPASAHREPTRTADDVVIPASQLAATSDTAASAQQATPAPTDPAPAALAAATEASAPPASDSQITANVKAELAAAAPDSKVEVTTNQGVVSIAGQVASVDAIALARQAAERVAGVRAIDTSAMSVSNQ